VQSIGQIHARWGREQNWLDLISHKVLFPGSNDGTLLRLLSDLGGEVEVEDITSTESRDGPLGFLSTLLARPDHVAAHNLRRRAGHYSTARRVQRRRRWEIADLANIPTGQALLIVGGTISGHLRITLAHNSPLWAPALGGTP